MAKVTMNKIARTGTLHFGDASLKIVENPECQRLAQGEWEKQFKRDIFARIVQQLHRLGWTVTVPAVNPHDIKNYGGGVARWAAERRRICFKGDLKGELVISGVNIVFQMWQSINCPTRPDNEGRYEPNKESVMPYLLRLEMERTRRRLRDYLCGVINGYTFDEKKRSNNHKPLERTAIECISDHYSENRHFNGDWTARISLDSHMQSDMKSADGTNLEQGQRVWYFDQKGRCCTGVAFYNINNMWWVITGKFSYTNECCTHLYTTCPDNPKIKRNASQRRIRLEQEMATAIKKMGFERAAKMRDLIFPRGEKIFVVWHKKHGVYHCAGFRGYAKDLLNAGKFTADECRGWGNDQNEIRALEAA